MSEPTDQLAHREQVPKIEMQPHFPHETESSVHLDCDLSDLNTLIDCKRGTAESFRRLKACPNDRAFREFGSNQVVREMVLDRLERTDPLSERLALLGIGDGIVKKPSCRGGFCRPGDGELSRRKPLKTNSALPLRPPEA